MHGIALLLVCLGLTWSWTSAGKVVGDMRWKPKENLTILQDKRRVKFLIFGDGFGNTLDKAFRFLDLKGKKSQFKSWEIMINNKSKFKAGEKVQTLLRTDALMAYDPTLQKGIQIYHHSVKLGVNLDPKHEYKLGSLENPATGDSVYWISYGAPFDSKRNPKYQPTGDDLIFTVRGIDREIKARVDATGVANFAMEVDWDLGTLQVHSSQGDDDLKPSGPKSTIDLSKFKGKVELHAQLIKHPLPSKNATEAERGDPVFHGEQSSIKGHESIIYSRHFVEEGPLTTNPEGLEGTDKPKGSKNNTIKRIR
ncbi:hypothetical protein CROQUDRAFT_109685 [Cronartium quercuum f. sp. fusiforme G11]|uniref:Glycoside hydrolase 131 catalytic N-terminal domain-containing protein n=1 Tax=Cronartium quercuum f. sp. fusiforme G11 TaxID=708437 RepID=A0A9P6T874_9BASI|nr:hypothetical protein CROQUDRAFT_109685 [Cronartium quercuum f. sp. fusiforme G11]